MRLLEEEKQIADYIVQDRSTVHNPLLCAWNRQHLPLPLDHPLQCDIAVRQADSAFRYTKLIGLSQHLLLNPRLHRDPTPSTYLPDIAPVRCLHSPV